MDYFLIDYLPTLDDDSALAAIVLQWKAVSRVHVSSSLVTGRWLVHVPRLWHV